MPIARSRLTCLFWNVGRHYRADLVLELVTEHAIDIVVLAEHETDGDPGILAALQHAHSSFSCPVAETGRLRILIRNDDLMMREVYGTANQRMTIRLLECFQTEFLFVAMHLPSKVNWNQDDQTVEIAELCGRLRSEEIKRRHSRTVLVGDLNMNPFEKGLMQTTGLHAAMTRQTAESRHRRVQGEEYPYFYNPMWGFFGDRTPGPAGTHYYRGKHISYDWNIYDQVLVRPDALPWFDDRIQIITRVGETSLLNRSGRPNPKVGSDHFPIVFGLRSSCEDQDVDNN